MISLLTTAGCAAVVTGGAVPAGAGAPETAIPDSLSSSTLEPRLASADSTAPADAAAPFPAPEAIPALDAIVVVQKFGEFRIRLFREDAPNHVAHFLKLVSEGFYDGMSFHRVIPHLLIQTGDPASRDEDSTNDGFGAPEYRLPPEPNARTHELGSVSMAWQPDAPGASGSQWLVSLGKHPEMDDYATVIGKVVEGWDTVNSISQVTTRRNRNPLRRVVIEKVSLAEPPPVAAAGVAEAAAAD